METDIWLMQKLEASIDGSKGPLGSFSSAYSDWKRKTSIKKSFAKEICKTKYGIVKTLDIGCNEGFIIFRLQNTFGRKHNLQFIGVDLQSEPIDFANIKNEFWGLKNCAFRVMDANSLEFEDNQFDIVICSEVIEHLENPDIALGKIYRVLKKNGLAIITTPNKEGGILFKVVKFIKDSLLNLTKKAKKAQESIKDLEIRKDSMYKHQKTNLTKGHISVKHYWEWTKIFREIGFHIQRVSGTGGLLFGNPHLDKHRIIFGLTVILDTAFDDSSILRYCSSNLFFELRKK